MTGALNDVAEKLLDERGRLRAALKWPFKREDIDARMKVVDYNIHPLLFALNNESGRLIHALEGQFGEHEKRIEYLMQKVHTLGQEGQSQFQTLKNDLSGTQKSQVNIKSGINRLHKHDEPLEATGKRKKIFDWTSESDPWKQQSFIFSTRLDNTGLWFLRSKEYQDWKKVTGQTLLCPGMLGAGKTIITSIAVDDLLDYSRRELSVGVAFIYCDYKLRSQQTADMLFTSLLKQLIAGQPKLPDNIIQLYKNHGTRSSLKREEIRDALQSLMTSYSRVFIILDAVDEGEDQHLTAFFSETFALQEQFAANIMVTTRPAVSERIMNMFKKATEIVISAKNEDVEMYVEEHMSDLPGWATEGNLQDEIKKKMVECVDGM